MDTKIKDRGWVKNVAIIFLSVMLVLTFFSNTIMNRSLPEVATQSIGSNTITAQVRGTGKVSATQNYEVKIDQTRVVKSVMVKVGQEVNAGDVLFVLSDAESDELEAAQDTLRSLSTSYQKALLSATESDYAKENRDIQRAKENLEEAEQKRDELKVSSMEIVAAETSLTLAKDKVKEAQKKLDRAQEDLADVGGRVEADDAALTALSNAMKAKKDAWDSAKIMYKDEYDEIKEAAEGAIRESDEYKQKYPNGPDGSNNEKNYINGKLPVYMPVVVSRAVEENTRPSELKFTEDVSAPSEDKGGTETQTEGNGDESKSDESKPDTNIERYKKAYEEITACEQAYEDARDAYNRALDADNSSEYSSASRAVKKAQENLTAAQETQTEAEEKLNELKDRKRDYETAAETAKSCQITLEDLMFALQEQQKADNRNAQMEKLDLQDLAAQVGKAQKRVNELREDSGSKEIVAEVPGVIESIGITAGNKTTPDTALATIELPDMGYTMSFSVTNEQARLIHAGDSATVSNYYYGSQIIATVSSVKTDPKNPQTSKLVTFDVTGDVNVGADLTVSVGQRSQEYDFVVPNSALRSDANGDFILVITAKNSPLGNRYIATRVDVTKIASDDTNTAVTGALNRGDFVITTSTKPIENGQQVRMQDNL